MRNISKPVIWGGIIFIGATGLIHWMDAPDALKEMAYKGILFLLNGLGAMVSAVGIYRGARSWGWGLGIVVALGALVGYIASRTVGMPGLPAEPDAWLEPLGVASMVVEVLFIVLAFQALRQSAPARAGLNEAINN